MVSCIANHEKELMVGKHIPELRKGCEVIVHFKIQEKDRVRIQRYQGLVMVYSRGALPSITVRKMSGNVGVERVVPLYSPAVDKIEVVQYKKFRQARPYYMRALTGKKARVPRDMRQYRKQQAESKGEESKTG